VTFVCFVCCAFVPFADKNFSALVGPPSSGAMKPNFIKLYHHEFAPVSRGFALPHTPESSLLVAELSCETSLRLCKHFGIGEWILSFNRQRDQTGANTADAFTARMATFPFLIIDKKSGNHRRYGRTAERSVKRLRIELTLLSYHYI
jgi:hypothetical protein